MQIYARSLRRFCKYASINPYDFPKIGLEKIEDLLVDFIADKREVFAPKYLNVIFNAVKRWCYIRKMIKTTKLFREIKFDKSSRKTDALTEAALETKHVKTCLKIANLEDSIDVGLYGLVGLRPQIIPQLRVKDIYHKNYEIVDGTFRFTKKPVIMFIPRTYKGNKGNITFLVFIPTQVADRIELQLNTNTKITSQTKISESDNVREVYYKMKTLLMHPAINFNGRPYLLRSYADGILDRITKLFNDEDFKEFLMGHRGKLSAIYQIRGLTDEKEKEMRDMYVKACDRWINENIFEMALHEDIERAKLLSDMARQLNVNPKDLDNAFELLNNGKMTMKEYKSEITELTKQAQQKQIREQFEKLYLEMEKKHNNEI